MLSSGKLALAEDTASVRARSLALFKESAAHYEAGRYSVAAALLEEAYALHPEPKLLYNLGRARESVGEVKGALEAYEAYLQHEPTSDRSVDVQQRIAKLRSKAAPEPKPEPAAPGTREPTPEDTQAAASQAPQEVQAAPTAERSPKRTIPWILVGSGGAVLAGALTLGLVARSGNRQADDEPVQTKAVALQETAERRALIANVLAGAGGALAIAGGAWLVFGGRRGSSKPEPSDNLAWEVHLGPSRVHCTLSF